MSDAVQRKAVAGVALAVGENRLVAEARVAAGAAQQIRVHAGAQNRQLRKAAGAQRRVLNGQLIDHVAVGGVHLVHQRRGGDFHRGRHRAHCRSAIDGRGAVGVHQHLGVRFGFESFLGKRQVVIARRKVWHG